MTHRRRAGAILAALLALPAAASAAEAPRLAASIVVTPEAGGAVASAEGAVASAEGLRSGVQRLFADSYGRFAELSFGGEGGSTADRAASAGERVAVEVGLAGDILSVVTNLQRGGMARSLSSTVPLGCPASLVAAIAGDIAFLHFASRDFSDLPLSPGPALTAVLQTDALQQLTGWNAEDLEPVGLAAAGEEITVCFPHRYLTLGPLFSVTTDTARDLHGQESGAERLPLSGIAADSSGRLCLLSEQRSTIVRVDPRMGTRQEIAAPGLPSAAARMLGDEALAVLSNGADGPGVAVYSLAAQGRRLLPTRARYASAFSRDVEGNLWLWDAEERRIRILAPDGREVYAIKPLFKASIMQLPQQMEVLDDGSFLLAGYGEVWKFERTGIPVWRLTRVPGRPGEQLPPSFGLVVDAADGSFTILDAPSRRLLRFSPVAAGETAGLAPLLARLDGRKIEDLREASTLALGMGSALMAWQFGDLLARRGGSEAERADGRAALLRQKTERGVDYADSLGRDLLYARADGAYLTAAESARQLVAESPDDPEAARLLDLVVARRREVRDALARASDLRVTAAEARVERSASGGGSLVVRLGLKNAAPEALRSIRVHLSLPRIAPVPSLASIDGLAAAEERAVELRFGGVGTVDSAPQASVLVTYEREEESVSAAFSVSIGRLSMGTPPVLASSLAARVRLDDALVGLLADSLLDASFSNGDPADRFIAALDSLGRLRGMAPSEAAATAAVDPRAALRSLSRDETGWTVAMACLAGSLGLRAGILSAGDRPFALVDTGIPLASALALLPDLQRFARLLTGLSSKGNLVVPLSGRSPSAAAGAGASAIAEALKTLGAADLAGAAIAWAGPAGASPSNPTPVPFPIAFPVVPATPASGREIIQSLREAAGMVDGTE